MLKKEILLGKLELVVNKLMNLDNPTFDKKLLDEGEAAISKGVITRDFGIKEWDWPQGVGIYGIKNNEQIQKFDGDNSTLTFKSVCCVPDVKIDKFGSI
jgi:unsaturated rhamnogalacturonyl hydrolase